jgi:hypothetical protein
MTIFDFNCMSAPEKLLVLAECAVFLMQREDCRYRITLYQLDGFYIEIYFDLLKSYYKRIHVFKEVAGLTPYLDSIEMGDLFV